MAKKKSQKSHMDTYEIKNHSVLIRKDQGVEKLWIDGKSVKVLKSEEGYNLYLDAYVPAHKTLLEAVKSYINKAL